MTVLTGECTEKGIGREGRRKRGGERRGEDGRDGEEQGGSICPNHLNNAFL